jgi:signal transduction protein with GAF and PtsI domain
MDTERAERAKKAKELNSIFETVVQNGHSLVHAERATLWMVDGEQVWSRVATGGQLDTIHVPKSVGLVGASVTSGNVVNVPNAYLDPRFHANVDKATGYHTTSVLVCPVKDSEGSIIGAIQMINKLDSKGKQVIFDEADERMVEMLATHVACFIRIVNA